MKTSNKCALLTAGIIGLMSAMPVIAEKIQIQTVTVDSQDKNNIGVDQEGGDLKGMFKFQKALVYHVLERLGVNEKDLTAATKQKINKMQTSSIDAFIYFSEGLDHLDNGRYEKAKESFEKAVAIDPAFQLAANLKRAMPQIIKISEVKKIATTAGKIKAKKIAENPKSARKALVTQQDTQITDPVVQEPTPSPVVVNLRLEKQKRQERRQKNKIKKERIVQDRKIEAVNNGGDSNFFPSKTIPNSGTPSAPAPGIKTFSSNKHFTTAGFTVETSGGVKQLQLNPFFTVTPVADKSIQTFQQVSDPNNQSHLKLSYDSATASPVIFSIFETETGLTDTSLNVSTISRRRDIRNSSNELLAVVNAITVPDFTVGGRKIHLLFDNNTSTTEGLIFDIQPILTPDISGLATYSFDTNASNTNQLFSGSIAHDNNAGLVEIEQINNSNSSMNGSLNYGTQKVNLSLTAQSNNYFVSISGNNISMNADGTYAASGAALSAHVGEGSPSTDSQFQTNNANIAGAAIGTQGNGTAGIFSATHTLPSDSHKVNAVGTFLVHD